VRKSGTRVSFALPTYFQSSQLLFNALSEAYPSFPPKPKNILNGPSGEAMLYSLLCDKSNLNLPYAAISALGAGYAAKEGYWLRADPVELKIDAANIFLLGRDHLSLSKNETQSVLTTLNRFLLDDKLEIQAVSPQTWFLNLEDDPNIVCSPLSLAIAKDIKPYLISGLNKNWWNRLMTEVQMLLFEHEVNKVRQLEKKPLVNSLWIWGEGKMTEDYPLIDYNKIWSDDYFVKGLLKLALADKKLAPSEEFTIKELNQAGDYLIAVDHHLLGIDQIVKIMADLLELLVKRDLSELIFYFGNGDIYQWQAPKKFLSFVKRIF
jgi:hypothetical protein